MAITRAWTSCSKRIAKANRRATRGTRPAGTAGGACGCAMTPSHTTKGTRRYRYYVCRQAQKHGWQNCPAPSLPAGPIEDLVLRHIQELAPAVAPEAFVALWQALPPSEQGRVVQRLVERLSYDRSQQTVSLFFRSDAGAVLSEELARLAAERNP